jgi:hypothetical protein
MVAEPQSLTLSIPGSEARYRVGMQRSPLCTLDSIAYCKATLHVICGPDAGRRRRFLPRLEQPLSDRWYSVGLIGRTPPSRSQTQASDQEEPRKRRLFPRRRLRFHQWIIFHEFFLLAEVSGSQARK